MTGLDLAVALFITSALLNIYFIALYRNVKKDLEFSQVFNEIYRDTLGAIINRGTDYDK